jgi:hypothetical protein
MFQDGDVGGGKSRFVELVGARPSKAGDIERARLGRPRAPARSVEEQKDGAVGIAVKRDVDDLVHGRFDAELLRHLARQRIARVFARFDFAAWEFPRAGQVRAGFALREEHPAVLDENARADEHGFHGAMIPPLFDGVAGERYSHG